MHLLSSFVWPEGLPDVERLFIMEIWKEGLVQLVLLSQNPCHVLLSLPVYTYYLCGLPLHDFLHATNMILRPCELLRLSSSSTTVLFSHFCLRISSFSRSQTIYLAVVSVGFSFKKSLNSVCSFFVDRFNCCCFYFEGSLVHALDVTVIN